MVINNLELCQRFANATGLSKNEISHLRDSGFTYSDGISLMLTEQGRNLLNEGRAEQCADDDSYLAPLPKIDNVNHPPHYKQGEIECIDAIRAALTPEEFRGYCKGNTLKYVWRELHKGGDESLEKAAWYLDKAIK